MPGGRFMASPCVCFFKELIFLVNAIFGLGIRYDLLVLIFVAVFGLLAVLILIILNLLGMGSTNRPKRSNR